MVLKRAVAAILQAFAVFVFFAIGFCSILLPQLPEARIQVAHLLFNQPTIFTWIGVGFFSLALLFFLGFYGVSRGRFLRIQMGGNLTDVKVGLIRQTLEECFKAHFPKKISLEEIDLISGQKLEIAIRLPPLEEAEREALFFSVEERIELLLKEKFGYSHPFHLIVRSI